MRFVQASSYYRGGNRPRWVVIHDLEYPEGAGAAAWAANYFASGVPKSAHYTVDPSEIVQSVLESDGAWHTPGFINGIEVNRQSIGIEHAGYASQTRSQWLDRDSIVILDNSARLAADIARRNGIPIRWVSVDEIRAGMPGFAGHNDLTIATGVGDHVDPGPAFPRDWYLDRVRFYAAAGGASSLPQWLGPAVAVLTLGGVAWWLAAGAPMPSIQRLSRRTVG